jgi:hypothetical protein
VNKLRNFLSIPVLGLVLALVGCGGSGVDKGVLADNIKSQANTALLATGLRVTDVTCAGGGPYTCIAYLSNGGRISYEATCDQANCVWRRV